MSNATKDKCHCGPQDPADPCGLSCPVRPEFISGQILSDDDLDSIITWTGDHLRLQRLRSGWGVACGLFITCDDRLPRRPFLKASPGYAVDPWGYDLVACGELKLQFDAAAYEKYKQPVLPQNFDFLKERLASKDADWKIFQVDLVLVAEELRDPTQVTLRYRPAPNDPRCDATRIKEAARLELREPKKDEASISEKWNEELGRLLYQIEAISKIAAAEKKKDALIQWLRERQLSRFALFSFTVQKLKPEEINDEVIYIVAYFTLLDERLYFFSNHCPCHEDGAVPLARIIFMEICRQPIVISILQDPPYRRPLMLDPKPAGWDVAQLGEEVRLPDDFGKIELQRETISKWLSIAAKPAAPERSGLFGDWLAEAVGKLKPQEKKEGV